MFSKLSAVTLGLCVAVSFALAQDPTKVEPTHYKLDFENDHVQVVSVHYGPHEKSQMHQHPGGVVVTITEGHLRFTDERGVTREVFAKPGEARWFPALRHKVENLGDTPYNAVYIGIKSAAGNVSQANLPAADERMQRILAAVLASVQR